MDPISLIPTPEAIPVSWAWLQFFLVLTTFLHFITMNIMLGSGFIAFAGPLTGGPPGALLLRALWGRRPR